MIFSVAIKIMLKNTRFFLKYYTLHSSVAIVYLAILLTPMLHTHTHTNQVMMDLPNLLQNTGMRLNVFVIAFMWWG